tara:strand:+ start:3777 stop:4730 length:954 start_codon:yes stop_codon:yes gene_type:complete
MKNPHGWLIIVVTIFCSMSFSNLHSQEYPDYRARLVAIPNNVTVGDPIEITITIAHQESTIFTITEPILPSGFEVISKEDQVSIFDQASAEIVSSRRFNIAAYTLNAQGTGYVDLLWVDSQLVTGEIRIELPQVDISSTRSQNDLSLRPLSPLFERENFYSFNLQMLLVVIGILLLTVYGIRNIRKDNKHEDGILEHYDENVAKNQLDLVSGMSLDSVQKYREFYQSIDGIIRQYIAVRYRMQALSLTVKELVAHAELSQVDNWQLRLIKDLLNRCDEVIYGRILPDPILADRDLTIAYEIIELNRRRISEEIMTGI